MSDGPRKIEPGRPRINPPGFLDPSHPDYFQQCRLALEPSIDGLIELAVAAGWSRENVLLAMIVASDRHLEEMGSGADPEEFARSADDSRATGPGRMH